MKMKELSGVVLCYYLLTFIPFIILAIIGWPFINRSYIRKHKQINEWVNVLRKNPINEDILSLHNINLSTLNLDVYEKLHNVTSQLDFSNTCIDVDKFDKYVLMVIAEMEAHNVVIERRGYSVPTTNLSVKQFKVVLVICAVMFVGSFIIKSVAASEIEAYQQSKAQIVNEYQEEDIVLIYDKLYKSGIFGRQYYRFVLTFPDIPEVNYTIEVPAQIYNKHKIGDSLKVRFMKNIITNGYGELVSQGVKNVSILD